MYKSAILLFVSFLCFTYICKSNDLLSEFTQIEDIKNTTDIMELANQFSTSQEKVNFLNSIVIQITEPKTYFWAANTALQISDRVEYVRGAADANKNMGNFHAMTDNYVEAIEYYIKALKAYSSMEDTVGIARIYNNIGIICWKLGAKYVAEDYFVKAKKFLKPVRDTSLIYIVNVNLASCYLEQINREGLDESAREKFNNAKSYINSMYGFILDHGNMPITGFVCSTMYYKSLCYFVEEDFETAMIYINKTDSLIKLYANVEANSLLNMVNLLRVKCYYNLKKFDSAEYFARTAIEKASFTNDWQTASEAWHILANIYKNNKKQTKELEALRECDRIFDSLNKADIKEEVLLDLLKKINKYNQSLAETESCKQEKQYIYAIDALIAICITLITVVIVMYVHCKKTQNADSKINKLNEELKAKNKSLHELNNAKNQFFSIIAHDLRNPVNILLNSTNILASNKSLDEKTRLDIITDINSTTKHLSDLLENLLSWARSQSNKIEVNFEVLYPLEIANTCYYIFKLNLDTKGVSVTIDVAPDLMVYADLNLINTVLRNLLSNAIKFTPQGGNITIKAKEVSKEKLPSDIKTDVDGKVVLFSVSDNGVGMSNETKSGIFNIEKNRSTNGTNDEKGTGLGLVICAEFVEKIGGKIWVESELGKGSTFFFTAQSVNESQMLY